MLPQCRFESLYFSPLWWSWLHEFLVVGGRFSWPRHGQGCRSRVATNSPEPSSELCGRVCCVKALTGEYFFCKQTFAKWFCRPQLLHLWPNRKQGKRLLGDYYRSTYSFVVLYLSTFVAVRFPSFCFVLARLLLRILLVVNSFFRSPLLPMSRARESVRLFSCSNFFLIRFHLWFLRQICPGLTSRSNNYRSCSFERSFLITVTYCSTLSFSSWFLRLNTNVRTFRLFLRYRILWISLRFCTVYSCPSSSRNPYLQTSRVPVLRSPIKTVLPWNFLQICLILQLSRNFAMIFWIASNLPQDCGRFFIAWGGFNPDRSVGITFAIFETVVLLWACPCRRRLFRFFRRLYSLYPTYFLANYSYSWHQVS